MNSLISVMMLASVLIPAKGWYAPSEPINIHVKPPAGGGAITLVLTDFTNRQLTDREPVVVGEEKTVDLKTMLPDGMPGGTYLVYAVPANAARKDFAGTPLVVSVQEDRRQGATPGPMVVRVEPLAYVAMTTDKGAMTMAFYYDVAPHTVGNFLTLAGEGFYDGLAFHRIVPDFVIQGGDPRGDGTGGPGYMLQQEFNNRAHLEGVLSMARNGDPNEAGGAMPRCEFANSAGSQFFVCLKYDNTKQLDRRYTAFGRVVDGMETVKKIADVALADPVSGRPKEPPKIVKAEVKPVTAKENPYAAIFEQVQGPSMLPTSRPAPGTAAPAERP
ncbi:MAG: peptidyl-prolyl cis-trans isomerase [Phycisphaerales bacterium]|jgi:cyclophilin family peptidyl-prolyl cis-trans isomerase|nr:peptidyl-prolyl cis-trans isomerase [Phycisphaerales bacterium]